MGLFDSIAGNLLGSVLGGQSSGLGKLAADVMSGNHHDLSASVTTLLSEVGGVDGLLQKAQQAGFGGVVSSWIGTGPNEPVNADQASELLGSEVMQKMAARFGIDPAQAAPMVAAMLPGIIDKLTPHGEVNPEGHTQEDVHAAISGMLSGGGIGGLISAFMGSKAS
ncbi:MAG: hypothetical protein JWO89_2489 [Verrucomicrobiaceae bacterium]|nr:hypothetical protein [Verrucomicrobiaceae bacterium]